jgi:hypothetical protein
MIAFPDCRQGYGYYSLAALLERIVNPPSDNVVNMRAQRRR